MVSPVGGGRTSSAETKPRRARSSRRDGVILDKPSSVVVGPFDESFFEAISEDADCSEVATLEVLRKRSLKKSELRKNLRERRSKEAAKQNATRGNAHSSRRRYLKGGDREKPSTGGAARWK